MKGLKDKEPNKKEVISFSNTIPYPWTMMVKGGNTMITFFAMLTSQRLYTNKTFKGILPAQYDILYNICIQQIGLHPQSLHLPLNYEF